MLNLVFRNLNGSKFDPITNSKGSTRGIEDRTITTVRKRLLCNKIIKAFVENDTTRLPLASKPHGSFSLLLC